MTCDHQGFRRLAASDIAHAPSSLFPFQKGTCHAAWRKQGEIVNRDDVTGADGQIVA